jgi:hypothetical protein
MIKVKMKKPFVRRYFCECEQRDCEMCNGGSFIGREITVDQIYDLIKNPPAMAIGEDLVYHYDETR